MKTVVLLSSIFAMACSASTAGGSETLLVVAFPIEARLSDVSCAEYSRGQVCSEGVVELEYEIDEVLWGASPDRKLSIIDLVHGPGFPEYITEFPAILWLQRQDNEYLLRGVAELRTHDNNEVVCQVDGYDSIQIEGSILFGAENEECVEIDELKRRLSDISN